MSAIFSPYSIWSAMASNGYRRGRHSVTLLYVHLVFVTKYHRKTLKLEHIERISEVCKGVAEKSDFRILEINGEEDHVHLLVEYPPKLSVSQVVNMLKGVSSRILRKEFDISPHKDHLWSPSYFAISCGGAPIEQIKRYIQNQEKPP